MRLTEEIAASTQLKGPEVQKMRNVVLMMTSSMDGFVVGPEEHAGGVPNPMS